MFHLEYSYKAVKYSESGRYLLVNHQEKQPYDKQKLKSLTTIYDGKLNDIGNEQYSLSLKWYEKEKNKLMVEKMRRNLST
ncbi:hypothetical protein M3582_02325 [Priestia megaterium]|uniref:hypothetical protein n=1 Tax=Priestia megaterium TaxID=1404 RepID=UPI0011A72498|nr:hypothetical protein [Priestia megaterium]MCM3016911.1 hypothetical protein [Priestia megaterium]